MYASPYDPDRYERGFSIHDPDVIEICDGVVYRRVSREEAEERASWEDFYVGWHDGKKGKPLPDRPESQISEHYLAGWRKGNRQYLEEKN
jgi:hypothetical protein